MAKLSSEFDQMVSVSLPSSFEEVIASGGQLADMLTKLRDVYEKFLHAATSTSEVKETACND